MSNGTSSITRLLRAFFGIFMVCVYLGMGVAMALNVFNFDTTTLWTTLRWGMAIILVLYGIYRGYRQVKGVDYYRGRYYEEEEDEQ